jgi:hydrogenase large subunit
VCFHHLPIEFDDTGRATLREGGWEAAREPATEPVAVAPADRDLSEYRAQPVTRVAGALEFFARVDLEARRVYDARTSAMVFRGYELILQGRDPRDAMDISSRVCGVCGGVHSTTASMALDMALPVVPPALGTTARNIAQAAEVIYDHVLHLCLLAGPDYAASLVGRVEPRVWRRARAEAARHAAVHGFATIADIMSGLEPLTGRLYLEAFDRTRLGMAMVKLMVGDYPHPTTMVPGGINVLLDAGSFRRILEIADSLSDYVQKLILAFDDLMSFYEAADPAYARNGERPANLLCFGRYDDPEAYSATYADLDEWSGRRSIPAGAIVRGELRTTSLRRINLGIEEFVEHAFYEEWGGTSMATDPAGAPISPFHPWNKETKPRPESRDWKTRYTWATAPRWDREVMEAGPIARNWMLALRGDAGLWDGRLQPTGDGIEFTLPAGESLRERRFEWRIPDRLNTLERNRARAYHLGITLLQVQLDAQRGLALLERGERRVWAPSSIPDAGIGAGFWEASRGALGHWVSIREARVGNYQIITPSTWNASPRDRWGRPGPYEEAVLNTPVMEEFRDPAEFHGIDLMRAVRSFDPCMPCAVHMDSGHRVTTRDVVSCACGEE